MDRAYSLSTPQEYAEVQLDALGLDAEILQLLHQKAKCTLRILDRMKKEYQETGKLSV